MSVCLLFLICTHLQFISVLSFSFGCVALLYKIVAVQVAAGICTRVRVEGFLYKMALRQRAFGAALEDMAMDELEHLHALNVPKYLPVCGLLASPGRGSTMYFGDTPGKS